MWVPARGPSSADRVCQARIPAQRLPALRVGFHFAVSQGELWNTYTLPRCAQQTGSPGPACVCPQEAAPALCVGSARPEATL